MKQTSHASYQTHNIQGFGKKRSNKKVALTTVELTETGKAQACLGRAKQATSERVALAELTEAFRILRTICRGRIL